MNDERYEVLSALIDGEAVDPRLVQQALAEPEGTRQLVDFARLRWELARDQSQPSAAAAASRFVGPTRWRRARILRAVATAAVIVLALIGAESLWERSRGTLHSDRPPTPSRIVRFQPGVDWHVVPEVKP